MYGHPPAITDTLCKPPTSSSFGMLEVAQACRMEVRADKLSCVNGCKKGGELLNAAVPPSSNVPILHCKSSKILQHQPIIAWCSNSLAELWLL